MRISDWSSDVCSSDLVHRRPAWLAVADLLPANRLEHLSDIGLQSATPEASARELRLSAISLNCDGLRTVVDRESRSEEHTSELQSLMRISYAVFCLKKKKKETNT